MGNMDKFILGPCSVENRDLFFEVAKTLYPLMKGRDWYLKGSFDKANRTSADADRGPGLEQSIEIFGQLKRYLPHIKIATDVHECWQIERLAGLVDMIQIPAFLCRQTDLIMQAAQAAPVINIKKGQWLAAEGIAYAVDKARFSNSNCKVWVTERGSQFGTDRLIVDFRGVGVMKDFADAVILDCTHSTQMTGQGNTGGSRELAKRYAQAAGIFGYDGVFIEAHPNPSKAISDSESQVELSWLKTWINTL